MGRFGRDNNQDSSSSESQNRESKEDRGQFSSERRDDPSSSGSSWFSALPTQDHQSNYQRQDAGIGEPRSLLQVPTKTITTEENNSKKSSVLWGSLIGLVAGFGLGTIVSELIRRQETKGRSFQNPTHLTFQVIQGGKK